ncbi:hypothetical protein [Agromyces sp. NPDC058110]|uniref:hypothetical protein n=1 Tax=Agromyces sp. NPDC058110 TaxID=3346345 RepID=UPI0036DBE250
MKRIDIRYGGDQYSVGGRELVELVAEVEQGLAAGAPFWIVVNDGEGFRRDAHLLITAGTPIAFIPIADPEARVEGPDGPE